MAETVQAGNPNQSLSAFSSNPLLRQLAVMISIAASVALGVAVVLWSQSPNYTPLYGQLGGADASAVADALKASGTDFKIDQGTGLVLVPSADVQELRLKLAAQGLPNSDGMGFEILTQDAGFGTSRLVERARYQHALEAEIARTITNISSVQTARVHLALPKQSVFVRKRKKPSASVVIKLHPGRVLTAGNVAAVVHLVASSIPELEAEKVTVVDHKGKMLSDSNSNSDIKLSASHFEYTKKIENHLTDRIEHLLEPLFGEGKIRAQVSAEVDFTVIEQTLEQYNPDQSALRSEQVNEQLNRLAGAAGIPGALTNQPPAAGRAPENVADGANGGGGANGSSSKQATRNYEVDRTITHTREAPASIKRLSVAVIVDDKFTTAEDGSVTQLQRTPEEVEQITSIIKEVIGFNMQRGDSVKVINSSFIVQADLEALPEIPMWEESWFWDLVKQVVGVLFAFVLIFVVLKPTINKLTSPVMVEGLTDGGGEGGVAALAGGAAVDDNGQPMLDSNGEPVKLPGPGGYENVIDAARRMVDTDPKRVAQLVKNWMIEDGG